MCMYVMYVYTFVSAKDYTNMSLFRGIFVNSVAGTRAPAARDADHSDW